MKMSLLSKESGVLKLVHPGGFVEIHKNPITAADVMKRNPRHCVTRPDVFKYPWIVVRPESVLKPGRVFFIVPYRTIHSLLQAHGSPNHSSFKQHHEDFRPRVKLTSQMELWAEDEVTLRSHPCRQGQDPTESLVGLTNFHCLMKNRASNASQNKANVRHEDWHADFFRPKCLASPDKQYQDKFVKKQSYIQSPVEMKTQEDCDESPRKQYSVDYWSKAFACYKNNQKFKQQTPIKSFVEPGEVLLPNYDGGIELNCSPQVIKLKSCLKKNENNNLAKSRSSRVRFVIPEEEERKLTFEVFEFPRIETP